MRRPTGGSDHMTAVLGARLACACRRPACGTGAARSAERSGQRHLQLLANAGQPVSPLRCCDRGAQLGP
jgi:hypothetical protein